MQENNSNEMLNLIRYQNKMLKYLIKPDNIMSFDIKFPIGISTVEKNITHASNSNTFKLTNLSMIGSQSWFNISDKIGNNKFEINRSDSLFYKKYAPFYRGQSFAVLGNGSDNINSYKSFIYQTYDSNLNPFVLGDIDPTSGAFVVNNTGRLFTTYPYVQTQAASSIAIQLLNGLYRFKISMYSQINGTSTYLSDISMKTFTTISNLATGIPTYVNGVDIRYVGYILTIKRFDDGIFDGVNFLANNVILRISEGPLISRTAISNQYLLCQGDIFTPKNVTFRYNNTLDYQCVVAFYDKVNKDLILKQILPPTTQNTTDYTFNGNLAGNYITFTWSTLSNRDLNDADITNIESMITDVAAGNNIVKKQFQIENMFMSGIYNQTQSNSNILQYGFQYLIDLIHDTYVKLSIIINPDLTIVIDSTASNYGDLEFIFYGGSNRLFGFYDATSFQLAADSSIESPNPIDFDNDGQFDRIGIKCGQLNSIGYAQESNIILYLQKGSNYLQNISSSNYSYNKIIPSSRLDSIKFELVDGKNNSISLNDALSFSCEINSYNL